MKCRKSGVSGVSGGKNEWEWKRRDWRGQYHPHTHVFYKDELKVLKVETKTHRNQLIDVPLPCSGDDLTPRLLSGGVEGEGEVHLRHIHPAR